MEVEIRHRQQVLYYSGQAFIIFGIWSAIKTLFWLSQNPVNWGSTLGSDVLMNEALNGILIVLMVIILSIDILFRLYIGLAAVAKGKGKTRRIIYVFAAVVYLALTFLSYTNLADLSEDLYRSVLTTLFLDVTSSITLVAIIINAWKLRRLQA